jgi:DNA-binding NarL/FixJ family response regulator
MRRFGESSNKGGRDMQGVRALVVDDFEAWRDFARSTLEKMPGVLFVAEASNGLEAVQKAEELQPDLVVLDIGLPKLNGIEVARQIGRTCRGSKIIFLSEGHCYDAAEELLHAGISAYILKSKAATELSPAAHAALNGHASRQTALTFEQRR